MASKPVFEEHRHRHWHQDLPYRALVHIRDNRCTPLYMVAGRPGGPWSAKRALQEALGQHGGTCFYCEAPSKKSPLTVDHVEPKAHQGSDLLHNLVVACKSCNTRKGSLPIQAFNPNAGRAWLLGVQALIQARLQVLPEQD